MNHDSRTEKPFFSIIIPTYNRAALLKIAVNSVLYQTFGDWELLVIDDGSSDNTKDITHALNDKRIKYIYQPNQGVSAARNRGINQAQGRFICFLDSDDRFRQEKLNVTYDYIMTYPRYKIFHTEELWYRRGAFLPQKIYHKKPTGDVFKTAVKLCCISISTAAVRKDVFTTVGLFAQDLPAGEDYDFWLRVTAQLPVMLIPQYLTIKEGGRCDQQSKKYPAMDKFRIQALEKILKSRCLTKDNYQAALEELRRKSSIYINGALKRGKIEEANLYRNLLKSCGTR